LRKHALEFETPLRSFGMDALSVLALFTTQRDWDAGARVLTDQYSPANLLNR
jgi:spermidine synthase